MSSTGCPSTSCVTVTANSFKSSPTGSVQEIAIFELLTLTVKFDTSALLRADKTSLAEYYNKLFQIGVVTINEVRKALDLPAIDNGDKSFVQVNVMTLDNAVNNVPTDNAITNLNPEEDVTETEQE